MVYCLSRSQPPFSSRRRKMTDGPDRPVVIEKNRWAERESNPHSQRRLIYISANPAAGETRISSRFQLLFGGGRPLPRRVSCPFCSARSRRLTRSLHADRWEAWQTSALHRLSEKGAAITSSHVVKGSSLLWLPNLSLRGYCDERQHVAAIRPVNQ